MSFGLSLSFAAMLRTGEYLNMMWSHISVDSDKVAHKTKLKLDKEFGGGVLLFFGIAILSCMRYYIPLCLDSKFRNVSQDASQNVPTSNRECFSSFSLVSKV